MISCIARAFFEECTRINTIAITAGTAGISGHLHLIVCQYRRFAPPRACVFFVCKFTTTALSPLKSAEVVWVAFQGSLSSPMPVSAVQ